VALIGVEDLFVIDTDDALLICKNDQSGKVGDVVKFLKEKEKKEYL
jgi:mannose-1-phosphate guanylyltransferase